MWNSVEIAQAALRRATLIKVQRKRRRGRLITAAQWHSGNGQKRHPISMEGVLTIHSCDTRKEKFL